jgi:uncharacterized repeat protein (TIGR04138 family)
MQRGFLHGQTPIVAGAFRRLIGSFLFKTRSRARNVPMKSSRSFHSTGRCVPFGPAAVCDAASRSADVKGAGSLDWPLIRSRAATFPEEAFDFVREGLRHTVVALHGEDLPEATSDKRHVTGPQLCLGLKEFAIRRYGLLAETVLSRWGIRATEDLGTIVYAMIDKGELKAGERDSFEDFKGVYDFAEVFRGLTIG